MRSCVGLYLGSKTISIAESRNRKLTANTQILMDKLVGGEFEDKVPEDVKIVAAVRDELRKGRLEEGDIVVLLPGKDLIIRSFEMPILPKEELVSAINFEAKKYIPFKAEDLIYDFQLKIDRKAKKSQILFFGIKKEVLERYVSIATQLGLRLASVEYSAFSLLRLSSMIGVKRKGVVGVTYVDLEEETNFMVLEDGFPLFSRDIDLTFGLRPEEIQSGLPVNTLLEKLKGEIRISLDYYRRKFPTKRIDKLVLLGNPVYRADIEKSCQDLGLPFECADPAKFLGKDVSFNLALAKAYSASLASSVKAGINLDFLVAKEKALATAGVEAVRELVVAPQELRLDPRAIAMIVLAVAATYIISMYERMPLEKEIRDILSARVKVANIPDSKSPSELQSISSEYGSKIKDLEETLKNEIYLTSILNIIPALLPKGTWLTDFSFRQDERIAELELKGQAYLNDRDKEFQAINDIADSLKNNDIFSRWFKKENVNLSFDRARTKDFELTNFKILCKKEKLTEQKGTKDDTRL